MVYNLYKFIFIFYFALEPFAFEIVFVNPLKIPLNLLDLTLLWQFTMEKKSDDDEVVKINNQVLEY